MASSTPTLTFKVQRCKPELIAPATPTPHQVKLLSDIDDQDGLRFQIPMVFIYRSEPSMAGKDPVEVIRKALAKTLVFYYPFAGRLREGPARKLMVDCNGEGVMFIEADADVSLHQFGDALQPPFPCFEELLYNVPGSDGVTDCPLLLIQVTRLKCGGFILGIRLNHTMSDGAGLKNFLACLAEMANGAREPLTPPVWRRELLQARDPPRITCNHLEYEQVTETISSEVNDIVHQSFFFGPTELAALHRLVPRHLHKCTMFDVITACFWCCRTKALQLDPDEDVRMMCIINTRSKFNPPLPNGYYGNGFVFPAAVTTAGKLSSNPFGYALELIRKVKAAGTEEYVHSVADLMVIKNRCLFTTVRSCIISDLTRFKYRELNFGWGKALYGGVGIGGAGSFPGVTFLVSSTNAKGENGILMPICLPTKAMKRFAKELDDMLWNQNQSTVAAAPIIKATL